MRRTAVALAVCMALSACAGPARPSPSSALAPTPTARSTTLMTSRLGAFPPLPAGRVSEAIAAELQAVLERYADAVHAPGLGAGIVSARHGIWAGATGTADGETPLDPAAQFGIGSVTKTVVAAQVLRLVESGDVELDRPIADYLGRDIPTNGATVRQVLGMRSGIEDFKGDLRAICADLSASFSIRQISEEMPDGSLFEPGTSFRYTNANYLLAGLLIEEVTGTTLARSLRSGVLAAPILDRLVFQDEERPTPPLAAPFVILADSEPVPGPNELLELGDGYLPARCLASTAGPAGGMASDPLTLARWGYLLYGGSVLGDAAVDAMAAFEDGYGLAVFDHESHFNVPALGHEGTVPGYVAELLAFPEEGLAIAVLMNTNGSEGDMTLIAGQLRKALSSAPEGGS